MGTLLEVDLIVAIITILLLGMIYRIDYKKDSYYFRSRFKYSEILGLIILAFIPVVNVILLLFLLILVIIDLYELYQNILREC